MVDIPNATPRLLVASIISKFFLNKKKKKSSDKLGEYVDYEEVDE